MERQSFATPPAPPTVFLDAHGVRDFSDADTSAYDAASDDIVRALMGGIRTIDLAGVATIEGRFIDGRVRLRMDGRGWSLPLFETSLLALRIRLIPEIVAAEKIADALQRAIVIAERKVAAIHDWSAQRRPTEDVE